MVEVCSEEVTEDEDEEEKNDLNWGWKAPSVYIALRGINVNI